MQLDKRPCTYKQQLRDDVIRPKSMSQQRGDISSLIAHMETDVIMFNTVLLTLFIAMPKHSLQLQQI